MLSSDVSKVNRTKSPLFSLESLETQHNSRMVLNVANLNSSLDPRSFQELRIGNQVSSVELRGTVNLPLSGIVI